MIWKQTKNWLAKSLSAEIFSVILVLSFGVLVAPAQTKKVGFESRQVRSIIVESEPNAVVWIDNIKFGATDEKGILTVKYVSAGIHTIRVRAGGFKETSQIISAAQKGLVKISLTRTSDEAELAFQQAENTGTDREKATELYKKAIKLRPKYAEAYVSLARVLSEIGDADEAFEAVRQARKIRPAYAEASVVEGRIHKENGDEEKAIAAFNRSLAEGKSFQPEAQTGLGLIYKERAENFAAKGDFQQEASNYAESAKHLQIALKQLSGAPDAEIIYQLLGNIYEKTQKYAAAVKVYEAFLKYFPDSSEADAVRSFIVQIKKKMSEQ